MRIKEFSIRHYGPLSDTGRLTLGNFTLLYGMNEDGKTLTIESLLKMFFKKGRDVFDRIERIEYEPDGYVIVDDDGKEIKFPGKMDLAQVAGLDPFDFRNTFVIKDSDLAIDKEDNFYGSVTDRLTGLRTKEISTVLHQLQAIGKLSRANSNATLSDTYEKIKSRTKHARELVEKIKKLEVEVEQTSYDEMEKQLANVEEETEKLKRELEEFENARKREKFEKGCQALTSLKGALSEIECYEAYNEEDCQKWRECKKDITKLEKKTRELQRDLEKKKQEAEQKEKEFRQKQQEFQTLEERKTKLDEEIKPMISSYATKKESLISFESRDRLFGRMNIIFGLLLVISLIGAMESPSWLFYGLSVIFSFLVIATLVFRLILSSKNAQLKSKLERIKISASKYGLHADRIEDVQANIQRFDEDFSVKKGARDELDQQMRLLNQQIKEIEEKSLVDISSEIELSMETISTIKDKLEVKENSEYKEKLEKKRTAESLKEAQIEVLTNLLGKKGRRLEEWLENWSEEISKFISFKDKGLNRKFNEEEVTALKQKDTELGAKRDSLQSDMGTIKEKLADIEKDTNIILQSGKEHIHCDTSIDLSAIKDKLEAFSEGTESIADNVKEVMRIFEDIEKEEEAKVATLFGRDSLISRYFKEITSGLYEEVLLDQETRKIQVARKDGKTLCAEDTLSGGTYDQLYLSIRMALGEKLLRGKKGFLIMDDPLIRADPNRLQKQLNLLKKICNSGWQIIYFTAKGEIKDSLKQDIKRKSIKYFEVPGISI